MKDFRKEKNPNYKGGKYVKCEICGAEHYRIPARLNCNHFYCSRKCMGLGNTKFGLIKKGKYKICPVCNKSFYVLPGQVNKRKYCSYECANESYKIPDSKILLKCHYCKKEYMQYKSYLKIKESKYCSKKCQDKSAELKTGNKSHSWKGGMSEKNKLIRTGAKWRRWRKQVFERDNWTCQLCNKRSSNKEWVEIHPHHIKSFKDFPKLRFDINNGITLCKNCHYELHGLLNKMKKNEKARKELSAVL